eukprot:UN31557
MPVAIKRVKSPNVRVPKEPEEYHIFDEVKLAKKGVRVYGWIVRIQGMHCDVFTGNSIVRDLPIKKMKYSARAPSSGIPWLYEAAFRVMEVLNIPCDLPRTELRSIPESVQSCITNILLNYCNDNVFHFFFLMTCQLATMNMGGKFDMDIVRKLDFKLKTELERNNLLSQSKNILEEKLSRTYDLLDKQKMENNQLFENMKSEHEAEVGKLNRDNYELVTKKK